MNIIKRSVLAVLTALTVLFASPALAYAATPFDNVDCGQNGSGSSAVCSDRKSTTNPLIGSNGLIIKIINLIAIIAGIAAVVIIMLAGFQFITAGGGKDGAANARKSLIFAIVGLVVIISARTIIGYILEKL